MLQVENKNILEIIACALTSVISFLYFIVLGSFYNANEHTLGVNILVWFITFFVAYITFYFLFFVYSLIFKKKMKYKFINFLPIVCSSLFIFVICAFRIQSFDDNRYCEALLSFTSIVTPIEIMRRLFLNRINNK